MQAGILESQPEKYHDIIHALPPLHEGSMYKFQTLQLLSLFRNNIKGMLHALHPKNILIITITQLFFKTIPTRRLFIGSHLLFYVISAVSFLDLAFFRTLFSHLGTDKENASL